MELLSKLNSPVIYLICGSIVLAPALAGSVSFLVIPAGAAAIGLAYLFFKRDAERREAGA